MENDNKYLESSMEGKLLLLESSFKCNKKIQTKWNGAY